MPWLVKVSSRSLSRLLWHEATGIFPPLIGMPVHRRVTPKNIFLVPIYIHPSEETVEQSFLSKETAQQQGLNLDIQIQSWSSAVNSSVTTSSPPACDKLNETT